MSCDAERLSERRGRAEAGDGACLHVLWVIDKLSMDGVHPSCIAQNLAEAMPYFDAMRYRFSVCDLRAREPAAAVLEAAGVPVHFIGRGKYSPFILTSLLALIRREGVHLLHCHGFNAANFGRLAGRLCGLPVVVHEHGVLRVPPHQALADRLLRHWTTAGVAVSQAVLEFMVDGRSVPRSLTRVIPNGVALQRFRGVAPERVAAQRRTWGVPAGRRLVGYVGRLDEIKGVRGLIQALPTVVRACPDVTLVLVGEGALREELGVLARRLSVVEQVVFAGFVPDVAACLPAFECLVVPSLSEGFSYAVVEAMASGVPLLATRVGGLAELIESGVNGWLVPPRDSAALAEGLLHLLRDPAAARRRAAVAAERCEVYSLESYARHLRDLYAALAAAARGKAAGP